jgi:hypothetical protein
MANDAVIEIEDETVIEAEAEPQARTRAPMASGVIEATDPASATDEAATALTKAIEEERAARAAAEQTAVAERREREAAERRAAERETELETLRETAQGHELTIINTSLQGATRDLSAAQAELEQSMEAGEFAKAAAAQTKLAKAAAAVDRLEAQKSAFEARAAAEPRQLQQQQQPVSAFEQYVSGFAPQSQTWLRAHPECVPPHVGGNAKKNAQMMAGHYAALGEGHEQGSPDYFRVVEEHIGVREPVSRAAQVTTAGDDPEPRTRRPQQQPAARVAAAPTRSMPETGGRKVQVKLTPAQQEVALFSYPAKPGEDDLAHRKRAFDIYGRELIQAQAEGRIGRLTH